MSDPSQRDPNDLVRIPAITVTVGLALAALVVIAVTADWYFAKSRDELLFAATACLAAGQLAVAIYTVRTLRQANWAHQQNATAFSTQTNVIREKLQYVGDALTANSTSFGDAHSLVKEMMNVNKELLSQQVEALKAHSQRQNTQYMLESAYRYAERWTDPEMAELRKMSRQIMDLRSKPEEFKKLMASDESIKDAVQNVLNFLDQLGLSISQKHCDEAVARRMFRGIVIDMWNTTASWVFEERSSRGRPNLWVEVQHTFEAWK